MKFEYFTFAFGMLSLFWLLVSLLEAPDLVPDCRKLTPVMAYKATLARKKCWSGHCKRQADTIGCIMVPKEP